MDSRLRGNDIAVIRTVASIALNFVISKNPIRAGRGDADEGRRLSD